MTPTLTPPYFYKQNFIHLPAKASFENNHLPFIKGRSASYGSPSLFYYDPPVYENSEKYTPSPAYSTPYYNQAQVKELNALEKDLFFKLGFTPCKAD